MQTPHPLPDEAALEALVRAYQAPLLRYCTGILCCEADAQDAVQLTFIKAWRARSTLRPDTDLQAWLYRIAYRTALDALRVAKRERSKPDIVPLPQDPGLSPELAAALRALEPLDRALVLERVLDELPYRELARIHSRPEPYLRTRYKRAKHKLALLLTEEKEVPDGKPCANEA